MQMKHLLVALLVLLAFIGTAAAVSVNEVEIRSTILHYDDGFNYDSTYDNQDGTFGNYTASFGGPAADADADVWYLDATTWAGFYYDIDAGTDTENFLITQTTSGNPPVVRNNMVNITYTTSPDFKEYEFHWGNRTAQVAPATDPYGYAIIGFFAEPYVALGKNDTSLLNMDVNASKIAKLVADSDDKYTLKTGATLELGEGYSLIVDQIDVDGNKAYLKLLKDGKELNSSIVNTQGDASSTLGTGGDWSYDLKVLGDNSTQVMRIHVKDVFQGTESSLVEIDGVWLVDYLNAIEVKSDVDYGKFNGTTASKTELVYEATNISLSADMETDLGRGVLIKTETNYDGTAPTDQFYFVKKYTEAGTYEVRSNVDNYATGSFPYTYQNFAAFYYDIDNSIWTEYMELTITDGTKVVKGDGLTYTTTPQPTTYEYDWVEPGTGVDAIPAVYEQYYIMGLFGEKYVPFNGVDSNGTWQNVTVEKMAKLIIDDDEKYTLKTGATLELGEGYTLIIDQIDVDGNKAYVKFLKDGKEINSSIVNTNDTVSSWILRENILNNNNTQVLRVHVKDVFQGTQDSLVEIDGLWLMDYMNATELKSDDKYGVLNFEGVNTWSDDGSEANFPGNVDFYEEKYLSFDLDSNFTMNVDMDKQIANNMYLKTADNDSATGNRFYFYVAYEIGDSGNVTDPDPVPSDGNQTEVPPTPVPSDGDGNVTPPGDGDGESWISRNMWYIIGAVVLIIIIAGAAYYFMVYKKQA